MDCKENVLENVDNYKKSYKVKFRCFNCFDNYIRGNEERCKICNHDKLLNVRFKLIKPHPRFIYKFSQLTEGLKIFIKSEYLDMKQSKDLFYLCKINNIFHDKVNVTILKKDNHLSIPNSVVLPSDCPFYRVDKVGEQCNIDSPDEMMYYYEGSPFCSNCNDDENKNCSLCLCVVCGLRREKNLLLFCKVCCSSIHSFCLDPPLMGKPIEENWCERFCSFCKMVKEKPVQNETNTKLWGYCGVKSKITGSKPRKYLKVTKPYKKLNEKQIFGNVPGVEVGMSWEKRQQILDARGHMMQIGGIHGAKTVGAFSVVLSEGYEDDVDNGFTFIFTGSGGRDLSGNKRIAQQSKDQVFTGGNLALARNCNAPLSEEGGDAHENWKEGKPVRGE